MKLGLRNFWRSPLFVRGRIALDRMVMVSFVVMSGMASLSASAQQGGQSLPSSSGDRGSGAYPVHRIRLLYTNDLHSHFRVGKGAYRLGGLARLATALRQSVDQVQGQALVVDGGDWSEGQIYYELEAGRTALEMMDRLGYDAAVIGNHDFLGGPGILVDNLRRYGTSVKYLAANLDADRYPQAASLQQYIPPYALFQRGGLRIGVIGVSTFDMIYEHYFAPVRIRFPLQPLRTSVAAVKAAGADLVVVLSHNNLAVDEILAQVEGVDVLVHAHDHARFALPVEKRRSDGSRCWIVAAGKFGQYLGELDLGVIQEGPHRGIYVERSRLHQIDDRFALDPSIEAQITRYEAELAPRFLHHREQVPALAGARVFDSTEGRAVAESSGDWISGLGSQALLSTFLADLYRQETGADIAFEQINLTSNTIYSGSLVLADFINALGPVWNPLTRRRWTLQTFSVRGRSLQEFLEVVLGLQGAIPGGLPSVSGLHLVYDSRQRPQIQRIEIGGRSLEPQHWYRVALTPGLAKAVEMIESMSHAPLERTLFQDQGEENWSLLARNFASKAELFKNQGYWERPRLESLQSDLAVLSHLVSVSPTLRNDEVELSVKVLNMGATASPPALLEAGWDRTPDVTADDPLPVWQVRSRTTFSLPSAVMEPVTLRLPLGADLRARLMLARKPVPVYLRVLQSDGRLLVGDAAQNNQVEIYLEASGPEGRLKVRSAI